MKRASLALIIGWWTLAGASVSTQVSPLAPLLASVAAHVARFQADFSRVIGVEHYTQVLHDVNGRSRTRQLVSDIFFFGPDAAAGAMTVRNVQRVDGHAIADSARRIEQALALPAERRIDQLRALADAGARYNLGTLQRNFNEPTLALMFGSGAYQPRFTFGLDGSDTIGRLRLQKVTFRETGRPTLIRDGRTNADIPASGRFWVDQDGVIWRTELHLDRSDTYATIRVDYERDPRLVVMVPQAMSEDYRYRDKDSRRLFFISGHADYADYRRFETSARIVTP